MGGRTEDAAVLGARGSGGHAQRQRRRWSSAEAARRGIRRGARRERERERDGGRPAGFLAASAVRWPWPGGYASLAGRAAVAPVYYRRRPRGQPGQGRERPGAGEACCASA